MTASKPTPAQRTALTAAADGDGFLPRPGNTAMYHRIVDAGWADWAPLPGYGGGVRCPRINHDGLRTIGRDVPEPTADETAATAELDAARAAAGDAHDAYLTAIHSGQPGGTEADATGEANVRIERARLAVALATGAAAAGAVRFHRTDVSNDGGQTWDRIGWGRVDALPGESADDQARRLAEQNHLTGPHLLAAAPWRIQVWTDPRPGIDPDGTWDRHPIAAGQLRRHIIDNGPVDVRTAAGEWLPVARVEHARYNRAVVTVMTPTGALATRHDAGDALDVRPLAGDAPADPFRTAPRALESRVTHGSWLRRFIGWQWLTPAGDWETVTDARSNSVGNWFIATASAGDWCEPDDFAVVRPLTDPTDRVLRSAIVGSGCTCHLWEDSPFAPDADTVYARWAAADCPAHPAATPLAMPRQRPARREVVVEYVAEAVFPGSGEPVRVAAGQVTAVSDRPGDLADRALMIAEAILRPTSPGDRTPDRVEVTAVAVTGQGQRGEPVTVTLPEADRPARDGDGATALTVEPRRRTRRSPRRPLVTAGAATAPGPATARGLYPPPAADKPWGDGIQL